MKAENCADVEQQLHHKSCLYVQAAVVDGKKHFFQKIIDAEYQ